jgi:2-(1,2-epoxy-1,2-dihydrophenyl)acetyl-CoA isomerase
MADYTDYETLDISLDDEGVIVVTLNRPDRLNAFDGVMRYEIRRMLQQVRVDDAVRALVLTGAGRAFCSGADLAATDKRSWPTGSNEPRFGWCLDLLEMPKPTISAINGVAAGGGLGLALLCDIKMCSTTARLLPIWMKRAIHPDDLITWTLPKLVGYGRALKWLYLAEDIDLMEAKAAGLIQEITAPEALLETAMALARKLAAGPTKHMALTKQAVLKGLSKDAWDSVLLESWGQDQALATEDREEGVRAFIEKRPPRFVGR